MMQPSDVVQWLEVIVEQPTLQGPYHGPRLPDGSCLYFYERTQPCDLFGHLLHNLGFTSKDIEEGLEFEAAISPAVRQVLSHDSIEFLSRMQYWHDDGMSWIDIVARGKQLLLDPDFSILPEPFDEALDVQLLSQA